MTKYDTFPGRGVRILDRNIEYWLVPDSTGTLTLSAKNLATGAVLYNPSEVVQRRPNGDLQGATNLLALGWSEQEALQGYRHEWAQTLTLPIMTPLEFEVSRHILGLDFDQYAEMLQVDRSAINLWISGRLPVSLHATRTIRLMVRAIRHAIEMACERPADIPIYPTEEVYRVCDGSEMMWQKYHFAMNWDGYREFLAKVHTHVNLFA